MTTTETGGFGRALKDARVSAGLETREVSDATKIQVRYVEALEAEDWSQVPGGIHGRGFVKLIAREIGADTERLLALYKECRGDDSPLANRPPADIDWSASENLGPFTRFLDFLPSLPLRLLGALGLVLVGFAVVLWIWSPWSRPETPAAAPVAEASTAAPAHRLEIRALAATWFQLEGEGLMGDRVDLGANESATFDIAAAARVTLADPAAAELLWDGEALRLTAPAGETAAVELPRDLDTLKAK